MAVSLKVLCFPPCFPGLRLRTKEYQRIECLRCPGYDEGGYSASVKLESFMVDFNLLKSHWKNDPTGLTNRSANITSFNVLGAAFGALAGLDLNDRLGRLWSWRLAMVVYMVGTFIQVFSSGIYGLLLFARIFSGLGAGLLTVTSPLYLSEVAPKATRGLSVGLYMVALLTVLTMGKSSIYIRRISGGLSGPLFDTTVR